MSGLLRSALQIGDSTTPTQNFALNVPSIPDGTVTLSRGNYSAATQDILTVDASGNVTFPTSVTVLGNATSSGGLAALGSLTGNIGTTCTSTATLTPPDNSTKIATTAYVDNQVRTTQAWTYVTTSRALSTTYYNTTSLPIQVAVRMAWSSGPGANSAYLVVSGIVASYFSINAFSLYFTLVANVPPGAGYYVVNGSYTSIVNWYELR